MPPLPKRKYAKARQGERRAAPGPRADQRDRVPKLPPGPLTAPTSARTAATTRAARSCRRSPGPPARRASAAALAVTAVPTALLFPGQGRSASAWAGISTPARRRATGLRLADAVCARPNHAALLRGPEEELRPHRRRPAGAGRGRGGGAGRAGGAGGLGDDPTAALARSARAGRPAKPRRVRGAVAAGALSPEDGLRLAAERGCLMAAAPAGTMAAILGLDAERLRPICGPSTAWS